MTTVLSFDQANLHAGYSFWKGEKLSDYGLFLSKYTTKDDDYIRFKEVYDFFEEIIIKYKPDIIVCEQLWGGRNINVFKNLVMLNAFLLQLSWKYNALFKEINIRKYRCAFGIVGKNKVKEYVQKCYPEIVIDKESDLSDAILLGKFIVKQKYDLEKC